MAEQAWIRWKNRAAELAAGTATAASQKADDFWLNFPEHDPRYLSGEITLAQAAAGCERRRHDV